MDQSENCCCAKIHRANRPRQLWFGSSQLSSVLRDASFHTLVKHSCRRDGGQPHNHVSVKEEDNSWGTDSWPATCSPKRRQWGSDLTEQKQEDYSDEVSVEGSGNPSVAEAERTAWAAETAAASLGLRRKVKRRRKTQLNDPRRLFTQDEKRKAQSNDPLLLDFIQTENKSVTSTSSDANDDDDVITHISTPAAACKGAAGKKVEPTIVGSGIPTNSVKLPQSCFDLLCSHVGFRGWRCYRSRIAGQVFCVYHQRESTPVAGICLYI